MSVQIITGDCRDVLRSMADQSVHCAVTSPPYFGLRDYGHEGQMGLEPTPDDFVAGMVAVFAEVKRVLRDDGTLWLNLGDSYAGSWGAQGHRVTESDDPSWHASQIKNHPKRGKQTVTIREAGLKPKDLIGIPWRVAFALRDDGWYLRQDIIWSKPNPMPESVTDRCTKAHEYMFLLSKGPRYYYDAAAIKEPASENTNARLPGNKRHKGTDAYEAGDEKHRTKAGLVDYAKRKRAEAGSGVKSNESFYNATAGHVDVRNKRSVWTVGSEPFPEAHFATFPPALIEPCIKAGCPVGGTVLDPFGGAGTTGLVADRHQRSAILIELNPEYAAMARKRFERDAGMFAEVA